jgi:hypothetical protein
VADRDQNADDEQENRDRPQQQQHRSSIRPHVAPVAGLEIASLR